MDTERAVRLALTRAYAIRHARDVPLDEVQHAAEEEGVPDRAVEGALRSLAAQHLAVETPQGWRPAGVAPTVRARTPMAAFGWFH